MIIHIGVDLGLTGAAASIDHNGAGMLADLPTREKEGDKGRRLDGRGLLDLLRAMVPPGESALVIAEDVRVRGQGNGGAHFNSAMSQSSLIGSRGVLEAACDIAGLQIQFVHPQTWKAHFALLKKDKDEARQVAIRMAPTMAGMLTRKLDHNRAEALLLALYGRGKYQ